MGRAATTEVRIFECGGCRGGETACACARAIPVTTTPIVGTERTHKPSKRERLAPGVGVLRDAIAQIWDAACFRKVMGASTQPQQRPQCVQYRHPEGLVLLEIWIALHVQN